MTARDVLYRIVGDTTDFVSGFEDAADAMDELQGYALKAVTAISGMAMQFGQAAMDFNTALAPIETLIPGQTDRINELKGAILDLSPSVRQTAEDLAAGAYNIISAFGDSSDTAAKLEISARAAAAGCTSTNNAINLLSAVTKAYGDTSAAAQGKVADLAFVTVRNGLSLLPRTSELYAARYVSLVYA
jgi:ABC-type transporter Mla subunit MlaD